MQKLFRDIGAGERNRRAQKYWVVIFLGAALCNLGRPALKAAVTPRPNTPAPTPTIATGEPLARKICASCHLFPDPRLLDKKTWKDQILPRMETFLGVSPPDYSRSPEGELLRQLHIYPDAPAIPQTDWEAIVQYYLTTAPEVAPPQSPHPTIQVGLEQFAPSAARFRYSPPATTLVAASPLSHRIFLGDDLAQSVAILNAEGRLLDSLRVENTPISLVETERGIYMTAIGSFMPSEVQRAELLFFGRDGEKFSPRKVLLKDLPRATQTEFGDFNHDGKLDFAMCLFGNHRGRFSWFENLGEDNYQEHVLFEKSGPIHCAAHDFNGDGQLDLGLLVAQATEAFLIFTNDGKGNFRSEMVFQKPPVFGHNYFELADFDGDGQKDLLVVNGDNGEYESALKNFHGIRIYLNRGRNRFEEAYFFPLNGATKAIARDFDGDGDLDIAAISFYPDYAKSPRESFVYLENQGGLKFSPSTFAQCVSGRWIVMDAGDVDEDGDLDIILGSYIHGPTKVPGFLSQTWERQGPSLMILKNNLR